MRLHKRAVMWLLVSFVFFVLVAGFRGVKMEPVRVSGSVETVDKNHQSMLVNGGKVIITPDTRVLDDKGRSLKPSALQPRSTVEIEALRHGQNFLATKILIRATKKSP